MLLRKKKVSYKKAVELHNKEKKRQQKILIFIGFEEDLVDFNTAHYQGKRVDGKSSDINVKKKAEILYIPLDNFISNAEDVKYGTEDGSDDTKKNIISLKTDALKEEIIKQLYKKLFRIKGGKNNEKIRLTNLEFIIIMFRKIRNRLLGKTGNATKFEFAIQGHGLPGSSIISNESDKIRTPSALLASVIGGVAKTLKESFGFNKVKIDVRFDNCYAAAIVEEPIRHDSIHKMENKYNISWENLKNQDSKKLSLGGLKNINTHAIEKTIIGQFIRELETLKLINFTDKIKGATGKVITYMRKDGDKSMKDTKVKISEEDTAKGHGNVLIYTKGPPNYKNSSNASTSKT